MAYRQGVGEIDETNYNDPSYVGTGVRPGTQMYRDGVAQGDIFTRAGQAIGNLRRSMENPRVERSVNRGAVQNAGPRPEFESIYEQTPEGRAAEGGGGWSPNKKQAAPAAAIPNARTDAEAIDRIRGDASGMPTYLPGYQPQQAAAPAVQQDRQVSYDPKAAADWRAKNGMGEPAPQGGGALGAVRDYIKEISKVKVDPSQQTFGEMASAVAERRQNARNLSALQDLAKTEYGAEVTSREKALDRGSELEKISARGAQERENAKFGETLDSTKALNTLRGAQTEEAQARTGSAAFEASQKGKLASLQEQLANERDPAARREIQQRIYDVSGTKPKSQEDIIKDLAEAYGKFAGVSASEEGFRTWLESLRQQQPVARAEGGMVEGYAAGGAVPTMDTTLPFINDYRRYAIMTQRMGATPVGIEDFAYMRGAAKNAQQNMPGIGAPQQGSQMGMQAFASGGGVEQLDPVTRGIGEAGLAVSNVMSPVYNAVQDFGGAIGRGVYDMTHSQPAQGMQPARALRDRSTTLQQQTNYATGGAIPVAGRKLEGPGTGTSDSLPAIIDGSRPAALSTGEYVIPADVVRAKGTEFFDKLIGKTGKPNTGV